MEQFKSIKSLGFIIKKETLSQLASEHKFSEFILEDLDPYPGFYDHFHIPLNEDEKKPRSIFAVVKEFNLEQINDFIRVTTAIRKSFGQEFSAVMGRLTYQNAMVSCIRIYMNDYNYLPQLIEQYTRKGMQFLPARSVKPFSSLIYIWKFMKLDEMYEGIYKDSELPDTYYLNVSRHVDFTRFETISLSIRNNNNHKVYDAAQAGYYGPGGLNEMVRIYDTKATLSNLQFLKEKYELELERANFQLA